jgi:polyisoprenoid-binding protein YceI
MKKTILAIAFAAITSISFATEKEKVSGTYKVNTTSSTIDWVGKKIGGDHNGKISLNTSQLILKDGMITGGKVQLNMKSITCEDLSGEWGDKLVGHLKSDDFFGVDKFGTSDFIIKKVTAIKDAKTGEKNYTISGDLTIKGITHPIEFPANIVIKEGAVVAVGEAKVDRTKYNVRYGSASFFDNLGDKAIDNDFLIKFNLVARK